MPTPRILQGPFRNVDPHTGSLAVYFRGPVSELFNMLNPESPGAISVLARTPHSHTYTRIQHRYNHRRVEAWLFLYARIRVCLSLTIFACVCVCVEQGRSRVALAQRLRSCAASTRRLYITRTSLGHVLSLPAGTYTALSAVRAQSVTFRSTLRCGNSRGS